jgi:hypothetical protein
LKVEGAKPLLAHPYSLSLAGSFAPFAYEVEVASNLLLLKSLLFLPLYDNSSHLISVIPALQFCLPSLDLDGPNTRKNRILPEEQQLCTKFFCLPGTSFYVLFM